MGNPIIMEELGLKIIAKSKEQEISE